MWGLIRKSDGVFVAAVESTDGYDLALYDARPLPPGDPSQWAWDGAQFVPRPPTAHEVTQADLEADPRWRAMKTATPAQVDTWLTGNVVDLASARRVLKLLILAVQLLAKTRT